VTVVVFYTCAICNTQHLSQYTNNVFVPFFEVRNEKDYSVFRIVICDDCFGPLILKVNRELELCNNFEHKR